MKTQKSNWIRFGYLVGVIAVAQFIILSAVAMAVYPGGYSLFGNFFSQLGCTVSANNGEPCMPSRIIFMIACTVTAILNIPFILALRTNCTKTKAGKYLSGAGTFFGIAASPFLALLSIFPANLQFGPHILATRLFFLLFGLAIIIYTPALILNKDYNKGIAWYGVPVAIAALLYIFFFIQNAAFQKFTVYFMISWVVVQGVYLWNRTTPSHTKNSSA
jgi:hypothetical membrane protein